MYFNRLQAKKGEQGVKPTALFLLVEEHNYTLLECLQAEQEQSGLSPDQERVHSIPIHILNLLFLILLTLFPLLLFVVLIFCWLCLLGFLSTLTLFVFFPHVAIGRCCFLGFFLSLFLNSLNFIFFIF